jgi:hypothetical protein
MVCENDQDPVQVTDDTAVYPNNNAPKQDIKDVTRMIPAKFLQGGKEFIGNIVSENLFKIR